MCSGYSHLDDITAVLLIKQKWSYMIRNGLKTMELRSYSLCKYENQWIGLATSGDHAIWGTCRISMSTLLNEQAMFTPELLLQHRVSPEDIARLRATLAVKGSKKKPWKNIYGISLHGVATFPQPVPYYHPRGAISLVRLSGNEVFERARADVLARPRHREARPRWRAGVLRPLAQRCRK